MDLPPAPNGLSNRWNLGLHWGICSGPGCHVRNNLLKCGACRAISYCSVAHQKADRPRHKSSCQIVKDALEKLAPAEAGLRAESSEPSHNPFETMRGRFWSSGPTRLYMEMRYEVTMALSNIRTGDAVEAMLDHSLEMLQLNPGDNQGVRSQVPGLYLRLGRDQEAYDFIKWWATIGSAGYYEWDNPESPFLNLHDEDILENVNVCAEKLFDLSMLACLTNLKARLLLDVQMLEQQSKIPGNRDASFEKKMEWVREHAMSDMLYKHQEVVEQTSWTDLISNLQGQVRVLVNRVKERNKFYWPALKEPERWSYARPIPYTPGSAHEINGVFRHTWYSWAECPPALELVKSLSSS
ncbi:hypothetical protein M426DRAFT_26211 [Hypoxylon sp. CI-4A]|nr:hypothetical protein M426DRAFT_26211 [Hypoxylon sp. CI-4A]